MRQERTWPTIRVGTDDFSEIRRLECLYVDKSLFLKELLCPGQADVTLITRPRRFGKSLNMSMLASFLDITRDSRLLFDGLAIMEDRDFCARWMNKYPVVFLTLKHIEATSYAGAYGRLRDELRMACAEHEYLLDSPKLNSVVRDGLRAIISGTNDEAVLVRGLQTLCAALRSHWDKPAALLIDDCDVPLASAHQHSQYEQMLGIIRSLLGMALKSNPALEFAVLTGCLRVAKESVFTGVNNLACFGIDDNAFARFFGFTTTEVENILRDCGLLNQRAAVREWYDGYRFGDQEGMYCPWDVLNFANMIHVNPNQEPELYWKDTSGNTEVRAILDHADDTIRANYGTLVDGGCVRVPIVRDLTYADLYATTENIWTLLYVTGYLTKRAAKEPDDGPARAERGMTWLAIPNREVMEIFKTSIRQWLDTAAGSSGEIVTDAFWRHDAPTVREELSDLLTLTASFHDVGKLSEKFYHGLVLGLFLKRNYTIHSNREHGLGRADIVIEATRPRRAAIIELKYTPRPSGLEKLACDGLRQIREKNYDAHLRRLYPGHLGCWCFAFSGKFCAVACETPEAVSLAGTGRAEKR